jgi:hypothetical protein
VVDFERPAPVPVLSLAWSCCGFCGVGVIPERNAACSRYFGKSPVAANYPMYATPQHGR